MKRRFAIIALSAVCLVTVFTVVPTNSLVEYYDPWLDINDDGDIDMKDVAASARAFGSFGDPTKNVNVMNWPVSEQVVVWWNEHLEMSDERWSEGYESCGFSQLRILIFVGGFTGRERVFFWVHGTMWNAERSEAVFPTYYYAAFTEANASHIVTMPVPSQTFNFYVATDGSSDGYVHLNFYLTWA